jgi:hypothetical protein
MDAILCWMMSEENSSRLLTSGLGAHEVEYYA